MTSNSIKRLIMNLATLAAVALVATGCSAPSHPQHVADAASPEPAGQHHLGLPAEAYGDGEGAAIAMAIFFVSTLLDPANPHQQDLSKAVASPQCGFCHGSAGDASALTNPLTIDHSSISVGTGDFVSDPGAIAVSFAAQRSASTAPAASPLRPAPAPTSDWHMTVWLVPGEVMWQIREVSMRSPASVLDRWDS